MAMIHLSSRMLYQPEPKQHILMLEHRGRAMKQVRTLLECGNLPLSEALIVAILSLATMESCLGNFKSHKLHLSALKLLAQEKGHFTTSSGNKIGDMIALYCDTTLALSTGRSAFKRRPYEPAYLCWPLPAENRLPLGFAALLQWIPISQDTVSILYNGCDLGLNVPCVTLTQSQRLFFARRRLASRKYFNYLDSVPVLLVSDNSGVFFEKILVLALSLFAWCGFTTMRNPGFGMYKAMITQLSDRLIRFQPTIEVERNCVAWMWLMVIDAWRIGGSDGTLLSQGRDMLSQFHQRFPEYRSWANLQKLTRLFFWTGDMEKFWCQRWEQLSIEVL